MGSLVSPKKVPMHLPWVRRCRDLLPDELRAAITTMIGGHTGYLPGVFEVGLQGDLPTFEDELAQFATLDPELFLHEMSLANGGATCHLDDARGVGDRRPGRDPRPRLRGPGDGDGPVARRRARRGGGPAVRRPGRRPRRGGRRPPALLGARLRRRVGTHPSAHRGRGDRRSPDPGDGRDAGPGRRVPAGGHLGRRDDLDHGGQGLGAHLRRRRARRDALRADGLRLAERADRAGTTMAGVGVLPPPRPAPARGPPRHRPRGRRGPARPGRRDAAADHTAGRRRAPIDQGAGGAAQPVGVGRLASPQDAGQCRGGRQPSRRVLRAVRAGARPDRGAGRGAAAHARTRADHHRPVPALPVAVSRAPQT